MATLSTYIASEGNAREAFEFYRDTFGGELDLFTYGGSRRAPAEES